MGPSRVGLGHAGGPLGTASGRWAAVGAARMAHGGRTSSGFTGRAQSAYATRAVAGLVATRPFHAGSVVRRSPTRRQRNRPVVRRARARSPGRLASDDEPADHVVDRPRRREGCR
jgi:hypothetical protein